MTRIDFYVLRDGASGNRFSVACRLSEKAWRQGHRVYIHTNSLDEARHMDRLLWTFREQNFIPHGLIDTANPRYNPILIGHCPEPGKEHDVLINLHLSVPVFFSRFERVTECIDHDTAAREAARQRYRYYRDHGYPMQTHMLA